MTLLRPLVSRSFLARTDPRVRLTSGLALAILLACLHDPRALSAGAAAMALLCVAGRIPLAPLGRRILRVNLVLLALVPFLLLNPADGPGLLPRWTLSAGQAGIVARVLLKGNAIVLAISALISTIEATALGHALSHLRVPTKLVHLFLFTVRYVDVLHLEHERLRRALRARGFRPRPSPRTWRILGQTAALVLARSVDRADRVLAAMRCRGFQGRFFLLDHFQARRSDAVFALAMASVAALLIWIGRP